MILLPSINSNVTKKQYATALRSITANITDKIHAQMALEDAGDVGDLKIFASANETEFMENLHKYSLCAMPQKNM